MPTRQRLENKVYTWISVKPKEEVCRERAEKAADLKHDDKILELHNKWLETKKGQYFAEKQFEERLKIKTKNEMYNYFMENYEQGDDKYVKDEDRVTYGGGLKKASDILLKSLKEIG